MTKRFYPILLARGGLAVTWVGYRSMVLRCPMVTAVDIRRLSTPTRGLVIQTGLAQVALPRELPM